MNNLSKVARNAALATVMCLVSAIPGFAQEPVKPSTDFGLYLRGKFAEPSVLFAPDDSTKARAADSFRLFYDRDDVSGNEIISLSGSLFAQFRNVHSTERPLKLSAYSFGVSLDQSTVNGATARDTIIFHAGGSWLFQSDQPVFWNSHYISANLGWITDRDFDLSVVTAKARYTPRGQGFGFGAVPYGTGNFKFQITPALMAEYQNVVDAAGRADYAGAAERFYLGTSLEFIGTFADGPLQPVTLDAAYFAATDLLGNAGDHQLFDVGLSWALTDSGNLSVRAGYTKGSTPTRSETDKVSIGLGLSF